jgi:ubiquinone/menaquinone biosynthesis C-methylase UbiE
MIINDYEFMLDSLTKFHNSIYISGWFHHPLDKLKSVTIIDRDIKSSVSRVGIEYPSVGSLGSNKGFYCQVLRNSSKFDQSSKIVFRTRRGWRKEITLLELAEDRTQRYSTPKLYKKFREILSKLENPKILDIGGRARSGLDWRKYFSNFEYTILDIVNGDNVDVVGDAHKLSEYFASNSFDAIYSCAVFEHLLMPWKVVLEMNKCMKIDGVALIYTHQTIGMHDLPWDFFRFSDSSWDALFNKETGFEIIAREMDGESYVLPFIYRIEKELAEYSAGFEGSAVLVRKISNTTLNWDVSLENVIYSNYPEDDDGQNIADPMLVKYSQT